MIKKGILAGCLSLGLIVASCSSDDDAGNVINNSNLTLNLSGLEDLGSDYTYEGWVIVNGAPVSTGTFNVNASGTLSQTSFEVLSSNLEAATAFVLTIEPVPDPDPAPAATKYLRAPFEAGNNTATVDLMPVAADGFTGSTGTFFLRTPTDEAPGTPNNGNDQYGVWFGTPGMPPAASLMLPTLSEGWKYEGWVVTQDGPLSTGTFTAFDTSDDNAGAQDGFSETASMGPQLPGEDFFRNAPNGFTFPLDIRNRTVVITVEPFPDNSPAPFTLKPLAGTAANSLPDTNTLELNIDSFPSGSVSR
ncbi:anti-sigma factor domain-containing protein [Aquimarina rhabdastrellae]